ncbi:glutathione transferase GstA [Azoarcus communis]|uniref:Glutathione transferase GstA n=1 Tax=Parazoarcus communis SWub3 = DSM 12120 TaxID=1121029 RepID=A0A323UZ10_9RHOO|nr:glutathione transferase GstA [Parazoarcus communis]NMG47637.1 glutathione transferase GstA [Parazoarcus communis]NMG68667.1 glutathione transferase GstA [Parazoarcus communis SWub3 = DSM 12120]PZA17799.1 glutathione transferase GstA [Azoarcus communis] [Parazoarcus communis SWub3 = DSM 12120]
MKLYLKPGACSLSPHIILEECGLPHQLETVDLQTKLTASGADFLQINPKGYVPALQLDDGTLLTEGPAIVQYLADQVPDKKLAPPNGSLERYQLQGWLTFIGTELHKSCSPFFNPNASADWRAAAMANLERRLAYVAQHLENRNYLMGADFSVADAYLYTVLSWMKFVQLDLSRWPAITAFQARVTARPAVQAALKAEGLI